MDHSTEPALVSVARTRVSEGRAWRDVVPELISTANGDRDALAEAALHCVRKMRHGPSDDFQASAALRAIEAALARAPITQGE